MVILFLTMAALQQAPDASRPLLTFSAHPELRRVTTRVDVGLLASKADGKHYWFRKTVQPDHGETVETAWTDTRSCPGGRAVLDELVALEGPRPYVYGLDGSDDLMIATDGVTYRLETETAPPFGMGRISLTTNMGTPLAR